MKILLDTCTLLWLQVEPARVPRGLMQTLEMPETRRSQRRAAWEIAVKWSIGKLALPTSPEEFIKRVRRPRCRLRSSLVCTAISLIEFRSHSRSSTV